MDSTSNHADPPNTELQHGGSHDGNHMPSPDIERQKGSEKEERPETKKSVFKSLGILDRFLALWIFLAMAIGIILGNFVPNTGPALQRGTFVGVSVPIGMHLCVFSALCLQHADDSKLSAVGLLIMMYPILCKVQYESLHHVFRKREIWVQIAFSIFLNWIIAPLLMVNVASRLCFEHALTVF
jgi:ACR3 family arsenite transporter